MAAPAPAPAPRAVDAALPAEASVTAPPATLTAHVEGLARSAIPLALGRRLDPAGLCAGYDSPEPEVIEGGFPELRDGPAPVLLATLVFVGFAAPDGCTGGACGVALAARGVVLAGDRLRWSDLRWLSPAARRASDLAAPLDDDASLAPLLEARDALRSPACAPSPRLVAADLARAWPADPSVAERLGGYLLAGAEWQALAPARCAAAQGSPAWGASLRGLVVYARSGETIFRVDVSLGGPWPGCVQGTTLTVPE